MAIVRRTCSDFRAAGGTGGAFLSTLAVFEDLNFLRLQISDDFSALIGNDRIDLHQIRRDANDVDVFALLLLSFWLLRWRRRLGNRRAGLLGKRRRAQLSDQNNRKEMDSLHNGPTAKV